MFLKLFRTGPHLTCLVLIRMKGSLEFTEIRHLNCLLQSSLNSCWGWLWTDIVTVNFAVKAKMALTRDYFAQVSFFYKKN